MVTLSGINGTVPLGLMEGVVDMFQVVSGYRNQELIYVLQYKYSQVCMQINHYVHAHVQ